MPEGPPHIPDPISRNRRERRVAWLMFCALLALAAAGWLVGGGRQDIPRAPLSGEMSQP